ncbi:hypothetical protein FRC04_005494 [Tulasnella sp. 424]|nr:hypothetical protein FRC04_005494 [Tulasnella sp. 424]KAG8962298.1 hypothetical protein FRC05_005455 [Tulasnella sp. 425]
MELVDASTLQTEPLQDSAEESEEDVDEAELDSYITDDCHISPEIVSGIYSADRETRLEATVKGRRLLQNRPPDEAAQPVINSGLLGPVVDMLSSEDLEFRAEAAWIVTNVASGTSEQTAAVAAAGAIPKLVALLPCDSIEDMENALWALGNIAGDSQRLRGQVVQGGGVKPVLDVLDAPEQSGPRLLDTAAWALTCYLDPQGNEELDFEVTRQMIPVLIKFIKNTTYETPGFFTNALKALDRIISNDAAAEAIVATGIAPRLVELCAAEKDDLRLHAVRCVGGFTAGSEASTEAAIQAGFLTVLKSCITSEHAGIRQDACWAVSNIAAGSLSQTHALFDNGLVHSLLNVVSNQAEEPKPQIEAALALSNLATKGTENDETLRLLVQANSIEGFSSGLSSPHYQVLFVLLQGVEKLTNKPGYGHEEVVERFKAAGGPGRLVAIRDGPETRRTYIGRIAIDLLRTHFKEFSKHPRV